MNKGHETAKRNARERRRIILLALSHHDTFDRDDADLVLMAERQRARRPGSEYEEFVNEIKKVREAHRLDRPLSAVDRMIDSFTWPPLVTELNSYQWPQWATVDRYLREWVKEGLLTVDKSAKPYVYRWVE